VRFASDRAVAPGLLQPVLEEGQVSKAEEQQKVAARSNALTSGGSLNLSQELVLRDCCFKWKRGKCSCYLSAAAYVQRSYAQCMVMTAGKPALSCEERMTMSYVATSTCEFLYHLLYMHAWVFPIGLMGQMYTGHALGSRHTQKYTIEVLLHCSDCNCGCKA